VEVFTFDVIKNSHILAIIQAKDVLVKNLPEKFLLSSIQAERSIFEILIF
jgi:hypothetical protein